MKPNHNKLPFALLLVGMASIAVCQTQDQDPNFPINTDRPTFSDSTTIVPIAHPQIESGVTDTYYQGTHTVTYGEIIYRQALSDESELRLVNLTYASFSGAGPTQTGLEDPSVGFKWKFLNGVYTGKSRRPELGVEVLTTVPIGGEAFRVNAFQPSARLLAQYNTDPNTQLYANLIVSSLGANEGKFTQFAVSEGVSYQLNPRLAPFVEVYTLFPELKQGPTGSFFDVGFTYLLNKRTQVDVRFGSGFDERRDGNFVGAGLSYRF